MTNKKDLNYLIEKYKDSDDYLAIAAITKIVLYEVDFKKNYVFGATIMSSGEKAYFMHQLELDEHGYIYLFLHSHKFYRKDFHYLHEPPIPPQGYYGKVKD